MRFTEEIWKDIKGYDGLYQVSSFGRVKRIDKEIIVITPHKGTFIKTWKGKILKPINGIYLSVDLCKKNQTKRRNIHRLVAETFIPNIKNKPQVNHIDGNKHNNNVSNLEWVSSSENGIHAYKVLKRIPPRNAPIICIETGKKYNKMLDAYKETGILITSICNNLAGRSKHAGGFHWKRG